MAQTCRFVSLVDKIQLIFRELIDWYWFKFFFFLRRSYFLDTCVQKRTTIENLNFSQVNCEQLRYTMFQPAHPLLQLLLRHFQSFGCSLQNFSARCRLYSFHPVFELSANCPAYYVLPEVRLLTHFLYYINSC